MTLLRPFRTILEDIRVHSRSWLATYRLKKRHPQLALHRPISIAYDDLEIFELGSNITIDSFCEIVALARSPLSRIPGRLIVGSRSVIGAFSNIRAAGGDIRIGRNCLIGQHVSLIASNHKIERGNIYWQLSWDAERTGVTIGDNVWIGCGAIVLPGVTIGDNAVVGAGSVVTKNIPAGTIWAGNPARQLRTII